MRNVRLAVLLALVAAPVVVSAQDAGRADAPPATAIARLELVRDRAPSAVPALRALGVAYYRAGRAADARDVLAKARALAPRDGVVALYLGLSAEHEGDLAAAREAYTSYLSVGRTSRTRAQVRARLATLRRAELQREAKAAVARETSLVAQPGAPTTVAVMPLGFSGDDSTLAPLGRGLAELLITDLARVGQLTLLERERVQAIADELALAPAADQSTAVRAGRVVRAGRLVHGDILHVAGRGLSVTAGVVDVPSGLSTHIVERNDALDAVFTLEKQLAFGLLDALGVTPTPAERALIEERPTRSLAAFLAYSQGLGAEDRGDFAEARRLFESASRQDPGFRMAADRQARAAQAEAGAALTPASVQASLDGAEGAVVRAADRGVTDVLGLTMQGLVDDLNPSMAALLRGGSGTPPSSRDAASSATGTDNPVLPVGRIIIQKPL